TIAKTGYRLMAAVVWEAHAPGSTTLPQESPGVQSPELAQADDGAVPASVSVCEQSGAAAQPIRPASAQPGVPVAERPAAPLQRRWTALAVASVALLVVLDLAVQIMWRRVPASGAAQASAVLGSPKRPYQVITAGGGFDLTPSLSPDGAMVAYASLTGD
ncbi:biopolymer transporter Tol, partial [Xanthomonas oryzae pv. oryzae]